MRRHKIVITLFILLALVLKGTGAWADTSLALPPAATAGQLTSGLRYVVCPNATPAHTTIVRLVMNVGSTDERDDERGCAHFLEHMAFEGSRHWPGRTAIQWLEAHGMRYGRDINAWTAFDKTIYELRVPMEAADTLVADTVMSIVGDWLDGIALDEDATRLERGTIIEELRSFATNDEFYDLKIGNGIYARRLPLGTADDINAVDAQRLRDFYQRCYVPSRATIIVVGQVDTAFILRRIAALSSRQPVHTSIRPHVHTSTRPLTYHRGLTLECHADSNARGCSLDLIVPHAVASVCNLDDAARQQRGRILTDLLSRRAEAMGLHVDVADSWYLADKHHWSARFRADSLARLLDDVAQWSSMLRAAGREGFPVADVAASAGRIARRFADIGDYDSPQLAEDFTDMAVSGERYVRTQSDADSLRARILATTPADIAATLDEWLRAARHCRLAAFRSDGSEGMTLTRRQLRRALSRKVPLRPATRGGEADDGTEAARTEAHHGARAVPPFPIPVAAPTETATATTIPENTSLHYCLRNGLRVVLHPTRDADGNVYSMLIGRGGTADLSDADYWQKESTVGYVDFGGIEGIDQDTLMAYIVDAGLSLAVAEGDYWHQMAGMAPSANVDALFGWMLAKICHPHCSQTDFAEARDEELASFGRDSELTRQLRRDPVYLLRNRKDLICGTAPSLWRQPRTRGDIEALNLDTMARHWHDLFSDPTGKTLILTGAFSPDSIMPLVEAAFGDMQRPANPALCIRDVAYLPAGGHNVGFGDADDTATAIDYVITDNFEPSLRSTLMLKLVRDVLQRRLIDVLREREHITYSPFADVSYAGRPQQTFAFDLNVMVDVSNTYVADSLVLAILADLRTNPIPASELAQLKTSFRAAKRQSLSSDASSLWRATLTELVQNGIEPEEYNHYDDILAAITPGDLLAACRSWLLTDNLSRLYIGPWKPKTR